VPAHALLAQDPCNCKDRKAPHHYRFAEKHETNFSGFTKAKSAIIPGDIVDWQRRYRDRVSDLRKRKSDLARRKDTPEDTLYTLSGYMWYVKHERTGPDPDCDFHIEIGPKTRSGRRVVVEVTDDNCKLQREILGRMESDGFKLKKEFSHGIPCTVTGLGFYDGVHPPSGHGRRGKTTFSSWELHPVKDIKFVGP
jgi:hypothetical protein